MAGRWIVISTDGTNNGVADTYPTNVRLFHEAAVAAGHQCAYFPGPGEDNEESFFKNWLGPAFGVGSKGICDDAIRTLKSIYMPGDKIVGVGFSRGGMNIRRIASRLGDEGFDIESLFIWDTVCAIIPIAGLQQYSVFGNLDVHPNVKQAFHALSIDEDREAFAPNLMNPRPGIEQVWFQGNHADVGGGYANRGYADIPLNWMIERANSIGLNIDMPDLPKSPCELHREKWRGHRSPREIPTDAVLHESVSG